jgi:hypothetical protein
LVAHLDPGMYREFYAIAKEQKSNTAYNGWENYQLLLERNIFEKLQQFVSINDSTGKNSKGFSLSKNGINTGCFIKTGNEINNIQNNINNLEKSHIKNNYDNNIQGKKINIIPIHRINTEKKIDEESY